MIEPHPILIPCPGGSGSVTVRWLRGRDGRCLAREYFAETPECQASFLAQAAQVANKGRVGKVPENGHQLAGEFHDLYELKPADHRWICFRHRADFYIVNGAMKKSTRKQIADYKVGLQRRAEFLADLPPTTRTR